MPYKAPYIDAAGLHISGYDDIINDLVAGAKQIYGQDIYLGNDAALYQLLSVIALKASDSAQALMIVYNNRGPLTAIGLGLDGIVKLCGIARKPSSSSTALLTLTGVAGTVIAGGVVRDQVGNSWDLPAEVTIGSGGTVQATAICEVIGAVAADPNTISIIATPISGWLSVTNPQAAIVGEPVETDSQLRARQSISAALPSLTTLAATVAALDTLLNVTRLNVVENPTNLVDANGNPPHSITCVVEGGDDNEIAQAIYNNRGMGCFTNGTTTVVITDSSTGSVMNISFDRPTYVDIFAQLQVHGLSTGFTTQIQNAIKTAIVAYLNGLQIGETLTVSGLYAAAMAVNPDIRNPLFSIRQLLCGTSSGSLGTADIPIEFNQVTSGDPANVAVLIV